MVQALLRERFLFCKERMRTQNYSAMATLIDQLKVTIEKGATAERKLGDIGFSVAQTAQVAYSINCIWLYAQETTPSRETLTRALPPTPDGTPEATEKTIEYIRKTMLVIRSFVSEKVEEAFKAQADLTQVQTILGATLETPIEPRVIEQLDSEEVEEIVQEVVPEVIKPKAEGKASSPKRKPRPWLLT